MLDRGEGARRGARRHRAPDRGDVLARARVRRGGRPAPRPARERLGAARDGPGHGAAVHAPRRRALRLGDRARGRPARRRPRTMAQPLRTRRGRLLTGRDASGTYGIQIFSLRREQGRLAELAPVIRILAGGEPRARGRGGPDSSSVLVELGMESEARRELDRICERGPRAVPRVAVAGRAHLHSPTRAPRSATPRSLRSSTPSSSR